MRVILIPEFGGLSTTQNTNHEMLIKQRSQGLPPFLLSDDKYFDCHEHKDGILDEFLMIFEKIYFCATE